MNTDDTLERKHRKGILVIGLLVMAALWATHGQSERPLAAPRFRFYRVGSDSPPAGQVLSVGVANNMVSLTWEPFGTGSYRVQYTDDLSTGLWSDVRGTTWPIAEEEWSGDSLLPAAYYVSTTGNDGNPGTIDQPWRTIQHAAWVEGNGAVSVSRTVRVFSPTRGTILIQSTPKTPGVTDKTSGLTPTVLPIMVGHSVCRSV